MTTDQKKPQPVVPASIFSSWHYRVEPQHWNTLGIEKKELIDKAPTAQKRQAARDAGMDAKAVSRIKVTYKAWFETGVIGFQEFDLFWHGDDSHALQIVCIKDMLEVHRVAVGELRRAYMLTEAQLIESLRTGALPEDARIHQGMSNREILRYAIENPLQNPPIQES